MCTPGICEIMIFLKLKLSDISKFILFYLIDASNGTDLIGLKIRTSFIDFNIFQFIAWFHT